MPAVIEFMLAFLKAAAAFGEPAHSGSDDLLAFMPAHFVQFFGHQVVKRRCDFVHHHGCQRGPVQQDVCVVLVYQADSRHERGAIGNGKAFSNMYPEWLQTVFCQHFG